ncbi:MAG: 3-phosphoshikimate 1-carboxyvinyltransferase, partial [Oscillospiraceae bacterium]|nr:3-phosphoshikimate 1-carboxyvinyltransferase [Oscillospiraceae bacterium]
SEIYENSVVIKKGELCPPKQTLSGHNDHRIVMALCLLLSKTGGSIEGAEAVKKSYPDFFEVIKNLGIGMEKYDN